MLLASAVFGKRAYYFDPDLLTIFNQDETQESLWTVRTEYTIGGVATLIGSYQSTGFTGYTVKYPASGCVHGWTCDRYDSRVPVQSVRIRSSQQNGGLLRPD
jgi:hypothetical protein